MKLLLNVNKLILTKANQKMKNYGNNYHVDKAQYLKNKEIRVYVLSADNDNELNLSSHKIESWSFFEKFEGKLPEEAEKFIELCEIEGSVYSLIGFQTTFNSDDTISNLSNFMFITNRY